MRRHPNDKFPRQTRLRGTNPNDHDPIDTALTQREAEIERARQAINDGTALLRQPLNPRGWPISTQGISGTSPGTDPYRALRDTHRLHT